MMPEIAPLTRLAVARIAVEGGRRVKLAIRGGSMLPLIHEPMTLDVGPLQRPARIGELVVFRCGDAYVAHRVVRRSATRYVTSGDACPETVEEVDAADVLGRVEAIWSDASRGAVRVDTALHRLLGTIYARARPVRLVLRNIMGRAQRLYAREN
jgi:hypothetical protein